MFGETRFEGVGLREIPRLLLIGEGANVSAVFRRESLNDMTLFDAILD